MILFNFTGLNRFRWRIEVQRASDGDGLWYVSIKWINAEVAIYSRQMGSALIREFNETLRRLGEKE